MYNNLFSALIASGVKFDNGDDAGQSGGTSKIPQSGTKPGDIDPDKNNGKDNVDPFADLWQPPEDKDVDANKVLQTQQTQPPTQQKSNQEIFDEHITSLDLMKGVDVDKITNDLNSGSTESLATAFSSLAKNIYTQALVNTNKIVDQKIEQAVTKAIKQSKNEFGSDFATQQMNTQLPFTNKPSIAPIAKQVLEQLIKKGKSTNEAVEGVKQYFQDTAQVFAKESGLRIAPKSRAGTGRFSSTPVSDDLDDSEEEVVDFIKILGGEEFEDNDQN